MGERGSPSDLPVTVTQRSMPGKRSRFDDDANDATPRRRFFGRLSGVAVLGLVGFMPRPLQAQMGRWRDRMAPIGRAR